MRPAVQPRVIGFCGFAGWETPLDILWQVAMHRYKKPMPEEPTEENVKAMLLDPELVIALSLQHGETVGQIGKFKDGKAEVCGIGWVNVDDCWPY